MQQVIRMMLRQKICGIPALHLSISLEVLHGRAGLSRNHYISSKMDAVCYYVQTVQDAVFIRLIYTALGIFWKIGLELERHCGDGHGERYPLPIPLRDRGERRKLSSGVGAEPWLKTNLETFDFEIWPVLYHSTHFWRTEKQTVIKLTELSHSRKCLYGLQSAALCVFSRLQFTV